MKTTRILETCLCVDDLEAAETFYTDVLGLEFHAKVPGRHCFLRCGDQMFLLFNPEATQQTSDLAIPGHGTTGVGHVAFHMSDDEIEDWKNRLRSKNVEIETEWKWPGGGYSLYFRDPAGNCLELVTPQTWNLS
jgi:catechol 2,3-dioxygenase-like lactoylglutathione lyase family enzyme